MLNEMCTSKNVEVRLYFIFLSNHKRVCVMWLGARLKFIEFKQVMSMYLHFRFVRQLHLTALPSPRCHCHCHCNHSHSLRRRCDSNKANAIFS